MCIYNVEDVTGGQNCFRIYAFLMKAILIFIRFVELGYFENMTSKWKQGVREGGNGG